MSKHLWTLQGLNFPRSLSKLVIITSVKIFVGKVIISEKKNFKSILQKIIKKKV